MQTGKLKQGTKATLNYSGLKIQGTFIYLNHSRFTFIFRITDPFTKSERLQSFIKSDILEIL